MASQVLTLHRSAVSAAVQPRGHALSAKPVLCPHSAAGTFVQPWGHARLRKAAATPPNVAVTTETGTTQQAEASLSSEYTLRMADAMGWTDRPYEYSFSRGLYYHEIVPNVFCGSQPRHAADVAQLKEDLGVTHIISLQQDHDMEYWGVRPAEIQSACEQQGITRIRRPVRDFDPHSLRRLLPSAVRALNEAHNAGGRVYVHCTAGLGRAPGVVIAYLMWYRNMGLHEAYDHLTSIRPCGPKKDAIRGATYDLMTGKPFDWFAGLPHHAFTELNANDRAHLQFNVARS